MTTPHITNTLLADQAPDTAVETTSTVREKRSATAENNKKQLLWAEYVDRGLEKLAATGSEQSAHVNKMLRLKKCLGSSVPLRFSVIFYFSLL